MSADSVHLQVCIRCRPFAKKDKLGVIIRNAKKGDIGDEVELISEDGDRFGRWGFNKAWWSAYNYEKFTDQDSIDKVKDAGLISVSQEEVYAQVGEKMKTQFMDGNAVVMFAYGLSGSGKTYSVFGPDMVGMPEAWFNFDRPHQDWGIFPRLAYDIITNEQRKGRGKWEMSIKYFQNVVDRILDLLSGDNEEEQAEDTHHRRYERKASIKNNRKKHSSMVDGVEDRHINEGFHVDSHGFVDITWCRKHTLKTWAELTATFKKANGKKAIAPTQFNPASTRGHCILVFEAKMPHPTKDGVSRCGRLYVCDLAGAEPAAEVHCAQYHRTVDTDGHTQYEYRGRDPDRTKTENLVKQGKKINLSLSEMTGFFRQMAKLIKTKKFNPNRPIPGCRTYFLGKFLKNTLMHAQTYLFAAIRPELQYQTFTESTLEFAVNASVVKLRPKRMDSHQVDHDTLPGNITHDHGLFTVENLPDSLHEKLQLLHESISGRHILSTSHKDVLQNIIERANDFLPEATCNALTKLIQREDKDALCAAAVMDTFQKCLFDQTNETSAATLDLKTKSAAESLKSNLITLNDRANYIATMEEKTNKFAEEHDKNMSARLRRGSTMVLHRTASALFDLDHRNTSVAHAVMLCSSKKAFNAVLERQNMPPTIDDDIYLEEAGLSGNVYIDMALDMLSEAVEARLRITHNSASNAQLEAEIERADNLQTSLDKISQELETATASKTTLLASVTSSYSLVSELQENMLNEKEQEKKLQTQLEKAEDLLSDATEKYATLQTTHQNTKRDLETKEKELLETKKEAKNDLNDMRKELMSVAQISKKNYDSTKKELVSTKEKAANDLDAMKKELVSIKQISKTDLETARKKMSSTSAELRKTTEVCEETMHEVLKGNTKLEEAEKLRVSQVEAYTTQIVAMRAKMEEMREETKTTEKQHSEEIKLLREGFSTERIQYDKKTENLRSKLAKFAARTWQSSAKTKSLVRKNTKKLMKVEHDNEDLHQTLESLHEEQKHEIKLVREQNIGLENTILSLKQRNAEMNDELETLKSTQLEVTNEHRITLAKIEHEQRSVEFQLQEQQQAAERSLKLEQTKTEEMKQDRTVAENSLKTATEQMNTLEEMLSVLRESSSKSEHDLKVKLADVQAEVLQAGEETRAAKRRHTLSETQSTKTQSRNMALDAKVEEQRNLIVDLESKRDQAEIDSREGKTKLRLRRASALDKEEILHAKVEEQSKRIAELESNKNQAEIDSRADKAALKLRRASALGKEEEHALMKKVKKDEKDIEILRTSLSKSQEESQEMKTQLNLIRLQLEKEQTHSNEIEIVNLKTTDTFEQQLLQANKELEVSEDQRNVARSEVESITKELQELETKCQQATTRARVAETSESEIKTDRAKTRSLFAKQLLEVREELKVSEEKKRTTLELLQSSKKECQETEIKYQDEKRRAKDTETSRDDAKKEREIEIENTRISMEGLQKQLNATDEARKTQVQMVQKSLESADETSRATIASLREDMRKEKETLRDTRTSLNQARMEEMEFKRKCNEDISSLRISLSEKEASVRAFEHEKESAAQENNSMRNEITAQENLVKQLQQQIIQAREKASSLRLETTRKESDYSSSQTKLKSEHGALKSEHDASLHRVDSLILELDRERKSNSQTRQQLDESREKKRSIEDEARKIATKLNGIVNEKNISDATIKSLKQELSTMKEKDQKVASHTREQLAKGAKAISNYESKRKDLSKAEEKIKVLEETVEEIKAGKLMKKMKKMKSQIKEHKRAKEDAHHNAQAALELAATHKETVEHHRDEHKEAQEVAVKAKSDASIARKALLSIKKKLKNATNRIKELEEGKLQLQQEHVTTIGKMQGKHGSLRNKLLAHQREVEHAKTLLSGDGAWQQVECLKKELEKSQQLHTVLEMQSDEHVQDKVSIKQSHSQLVEQYELEIATLRTKLGGRDEQLRSSRQDAQLTAAALRKDITTTKMERSSAETERNKMERRLKGEMEARKHDVLNMLRSTERAFQNEENDANDTSNTKEQQNNTPAALEDQKISSTAITTTTTVNSFNDGYTVESILTAHRSLCERKSDTERLRMENHVLTEQELVNLRCAVESAQEETKRCEEVLQRLREKHDSVEVECQNLTEISRDARSEVIRLSAMITNDQKTNETQQEELRLEIETLRTTHREALQKLSNIREERDTISRQQIAELEMDIRNNDRSKAESAMERNVLTRQLETDQIESERISLELNQLKQENTKSIRESEVRKQESRTDKERLVSLQKRATDAEVRLKTSEEEMLNSEKRIAVMERDLENFKVKEETSLMNLQHCTEELERNQTRFSNEKERFALQIQQLRSETTGINKELTAERGRISDRQIEIRTATQRAEIAERRFESLQEELSLCRSELFECKKEIEEKRNELRAQIERSDTNEREHRSATIQLSRLADGHERDGKRLADLLARTEERGNELKAKLEEVQRRYTRSENAARDAKEQVEDTIHTATTALADQVAALEKQRTTMEEERKLIQDKLSRVNETLIEREIETKTIKLALEKSNKELFEATHTLKNEQMEQNQSKQRVKELESAVRALDSEREELIKTVEKDRNDLKTIQTEEEKKRNEMKDVLIKMKFERTTLLSQSETFQKTLARLSEEKDKLSSLGAMERNALVLEMQHLSSKHASSLELFEAKHQQVVNAHDLLMEHRSSLETETTTLRLDLERLEREKVAYIEVSDRQRDLLEKLKLELNDTVSSSRASLMDTKTELSETSRRMHIAEESNKGYVEQVEHTRGKLEKSREELELTRNRLDKFRESYRVAQTCMNESNTKMEKLKIKLITSETELDDIKQDADLTESRLREELQDSEIKVRELEPAAKRNVTLKERKEDLEERLHDMNVDLEEEYNARTVVEKALAVLFGNEKNHLDSINHCQSMLDAVEREVAREIARDASRQSRSRNGRRTPRRKTGKGNTTPRTSGTPGKEPFLHQGEGHLSSGDVVLMTPSQNEHHVHTPHGSGHRHCPSCEAKELHESSPFAADNRSRHNEKGALDTNMLSTTAITPGKRKGRRIHTALISKTQRIAVELSAAILLFEKSFQRYRENHFLR